MASELSQAEVLEFLCRAGGRASNAALLGHFGGLLRAPFACPAELQRRRQRFKGFVNAVATVRQEQPGAPKLVVLRRRYRELVGEEDPPPHTHSRPPSPPPGSCHQHLSEGDPPLGGPPPLHCATRTSKGGLHPQHGQHEPPTCPPGGPTESWGAQTPPPPNPPRSLHQHPSKRVRDPQQPPRPWDELPPQQEPPACPLKGPPSPARSFHQHPSKGGLTPQPPHPWGPPLQHRQQEPPTCPPGGPRGGVPPPPLPPKRRPRHPSKGDPRLLSQPSQPWDPPLQQVQQEPPTCPPGGRQGGPPPPPPRSFHRHRSEEIRDPLLPPQPPHPWDLLSSSSNQLPPCPPGGTNGGPRVSRGAQPPPPPSPPRSLNQHPSEEVQYPQMPPQPPHPWGAPPLPSSLPVGAPPCHDTPQRRIHEWLEKASPPPCLLTESPLRHQQDHCPGWPSPPSSTWSTCPSPSLDSQLGRFPATVVGTMQDPVPVFRSIRCQLSLQDLEDFVEQESLPSSSSSSSNASGGSDACRLESGPSYPTSVHQNGHGRSSILDTWSGPEVPHHKPRANGLVVPPARKSSPPRDTCFILLTQSTWGSSSSEEWLDKDSRSQNRPLRKVARLPPHLDATVGPRPVLTCIPVFEGLAPDTEGSTEHRSTSVPLESREHTWLVKVAMGSWMQVRALLLEDPHLATRKDFVSGYTVLHWLAKHGNAQVLQEVVASVGKAGVTLDVNAKSGCGYTPLHLAAIHGHQLVIKVLVQKLRCLIQVRDSSGKKPWQYLSDTTSGEVWKLLGAPRDKTIFSTRPITRTASSSSALARNSKSPQLARKITRKTSLAAYLKPQHIKWKMANKYPPLQEREEYSD